ncbi:hypothetical protein, partial [Enterococcus italicus]|uniref:hypothetical protein n=1 Tax=Enterococcus italicus TaxID=246144 RepID=UPI0020744370
MVFSFLGLVTIGVTSTSKKAEIYIKNTLSRPTFIVTDKDNPERLNYIGVHIVTFSNEEKKIKPII